MSNKNRFEAFKSDPRFRKLQRKVKIAEASKAKKVKVDDRFSNVLTNPDFKAFSGPTLKSRGAKFSGKPVEFVLEDDEENPNNDQPTSVESAEKADDDDESFADESEESDEQGYLYDPARGIGNSDSETDLSDDAVDYGDEYQGPEAIGSLLHNWNFNNDNVETTERSSSTLALCNFDAATIKAQDLFTLFQSFVPLGGQLLDVKIYLSDYGREKVALEASEGPVGLRTSNDDDREEDDPDVIESVRLYQAQKLRYHYAIIRCSDEQTASHLYNSCDGMEFETSALFVDLRFVADTEVFDQEAVVDSFKSGDSMQKYIPNVFKNKSLSHEKADLTWDVTDPRRVEVFQKLIETDEDLDDFNAYLASSSSDDEVDDSVKKTSQLLAEKRKAILLGLEKSSTQENSEEAVGRQLEDGNKSITIKINPEDMKTLTPENSSDESSDESNDDEGKTKFSRNEMIPDHQMKDKTGRNESVQPSDLALLLADTEDGEYKHFDYNKIVKNDNLPAKFKSKLKKSTDDTFHVDTSDLRFRAVFERAEFALDPSDPKFKPSRAMKEILQKRSHIREKLKEDDVKHESKTPQTVAPSTTESKESSLQNLVQSIKAKSANRKKAKTK